ncbi:Serine/threonine-protein phosphatase 2A activator 1 [Tulasnella sp. JGI-2019a]|nr:Serine/threonine-protein phosphatase 2A activator 1 [Tulasnella sp. JGI-2019a]KAG9016400.1 Serine/threonine-protein phosphatase 2A activator 1 [Tulasnella sp. JGI-2019a]KAG9028390.1 Serine/threonine-protein phosphatase 2A activator 1 [Tulasnella sp. JGI-2019a]
MATVVLPELRHYTLPAKLIVPRRRIQSDADVEEWKSTQGYLDYGLFLRRLNMAVIGHYLPYSPPPDGISEAVKKTVELLDVVLGWIDEIPPQKSTQRYGNLAFRDWGNRLGQRLNSLMETLLPSSLYPAIPLVEPYILQAFGSFTRLDYGTGHELSFGMFMCCLTLLRFYQPTPEEERALVLVVFLKYLEVVWKLQDVYKLEPAGSHGVWGLDDYCFLPYVWGSGQAQEHITSRPPDILQPPLSPDTLYNLAITRILQLKTGPFHEHSPQLHSIATSVPTWWKVNQGLFKMYEAECLSKKVVVQHMPLGGILEWADADVSPDVQTGRSAARGLTIATPVSGTPAQELAASPWMADGGVSQPSSAIEPNMLLPQASPMSATSLLPNVAQSPRPRPKGGRLAAALANSPRQDNVALDPIAEPEKPSEEASAPANGAEIGHTMGEDTIDSALRPPSEPESMSTSVAEPQVASHQLEPVVQTSPQHIAKILAENPVDH